MTKVTVSALFVYPIKSARGIEVRSALVEERGFQHDRRFMLVDADGDFLTQRRHSRLALVDVRLEGEHIVVEAPGMGPLRVSLASTSPTASEARPVRVWRDTVAAVSAGAEARAYFSDYLQIACDLVRMPDATRRRVDPDYATRPDDVVSFADGFPFLVISTASLEDLNARMSESLPMTRFRPNIVVTGCDAFAEDTWRALTIGGIPFRVVKPCARCMIPTIDPATGVAGREPLATLAKYRKRGTKVHFGQNAIAHGEGAIAVGDTLTREG